MTEALLTQLETGPLYRFADWPNPAVPTIAAGLYTVWDERVFVYVGMAGRGLSATALTERRAGGKPTGLYDRLNSHAAGRRSGDQFCVYVSDRLVLPTLSPTDIQAIAEGTLKLDELIRRYIHERLSYRFVETTDGVEAARIELAIRRQGLSGRRPLLNPNNG
jgi:hypothetical protein